VQTVTETKPHHKPTRTCAGCGRHEEADAMVRLVRGPGGEVAVDAAARAVSRLAVGGRGAHVHARPQCIAKACVGGLARSFKAQVTVDAKTLSAAIVDACDRRVAGLVSAARRAGALAVGADAACAALEEGAPLVVVASDAGSVVSRGAIERAVLAGRAVAWKEKTAIGALLARNEVAVCAVLDVGIATELMKARSLADAVSK
jgi:predicted RNA-binding protein YlxR (DUF448 family)